LQIDVLGDAAGQSIEVRRWQERRHQVGRRVGRAEIGDVRRRHPVVGRRHRRAGALAAVAFECAQLLVDLALRDRHRRLHRAVRPERHARTGPGHHLLRRLAVIAGTVHRHLLAEQEAEEAAARADRGGGNAAADAERRRRRLQGHRIGLADLATDQTEHALGRGHRQFAGLAVRVVDELVQHHLGIRPDGECRAVDEQQLRLALRPRHDLLVAEHVEADVQGA
jgi:hypothetical protein